MNNNIDFKGDINKLISEYKENIQIKKLSDEENNEIADYVIIFKNEHTDNHNSGNKYGFYYHLRNSSTILKDFFTFKMGYVPYLVSTSIIVLFAMTLFFPNNRNSIQKDIISKNNIQLSTKKDSSINNIVNNELVQNIQKPKIKHNLQKKSSKSSTNEFILESETVILASRTVNKDETEKLIDIKVDIAKNVFLENGLKYQTNESNFESEWLLSNNDSIHKLVISNSIIDKKYKFESKIISKLRPNNKTTFQKISNKEKLVDIYREICQEILSKRYSLQNQK